MSSAWEDVKSIFNSGKRKRGQFYDESCSESDDDYSFENLDKSEKQDKKAQPIVSPENIQGLLNSSLNLINFFNPMYHSNQLYLLPEFLQLNRNFLIQNQLNKTSSDLFMNCLLNSRAESSNTTTRNKEETDSTLIKNKTFFSIQEHFK